MAERRMFAKSIIDSDAFLDMPASSQSLYFHLSMRADDDGFINNPKRVQRLIGSSEDDMKILVAKRYLITFDSGVVVIKHWKIHNYIQKDRYKPTLYEEEKEQIVLKKNKSYTEKNKTIGMSGTRCIQDVSNMDTGDVQDVRVGKVRQGKSKESSSKEEEDSKSKKNKFGDYKQKKQIVSQPFDPSSSHFGDEPDKPTADDFNTEEESVVEA